MAKYIRYTLAALCLAASVGCLALLVSSCSTVDQFFGPNYIRSPESLYIEIAGGMVIMQAIDNTGGRPLASFKRGDRMFPSPEYPDDSGLFGAIGDTIYFPLWYPALVFALAGVGVLRAGRFTIRSALIATTIVALLLGMVVAL